MRNRNQTPVIPPPAKNHDGSEDTYPTKPDKWDGMTDEDIKRFCAE